MINITLRFFEDSGLISRMIAFLTFNYHAQRTTGIVPDRHHVHTDKLDAVHGRISSAGCACYT